MSKFNPEKLYVEFRNEVTKVHPIIPRRYTLTHSDATADIFLTIGMIYAYDKINAMRDQVLGEWINIEGRYVYYVHLDVDGLFDTNSVFIRNKIFIRELPLALKAIRYGDMEFFNMHSELDCAPIIVHFISADPRFERTENWGVFSNYDMNN